MPAWFCLVCDRGCLSLQNEKIGKDIPEFLISSPTCELSYSLIYNGSYNCLPSSISCKIALRTPVVPIKLKKKKEKKKTLMNASTILPGSQARKLENHY